MTYRLIMAPQAKTDVAEAVTYYNSRGKGLGNRFKKSFKATVQILRKSPFFQIRYKEFRVLQVKKFPYLIHYHVDADLAEVVVLAVICTHRDPDSHWL